MYSVKQVSEIMNLSPHTIRYYDKESLFPYLKRGDKQERLFSDEDLLWVQLVQCLRQTGMSLDDIRHYIDLCKEGDSTVAERYAIMIRQKEKAELEAAIAQERVKLLGMKVEFYKNLLDGEVLEDSCNPLYKKRLFL